MMLRIPAFRVVEGDLTSYGLVKEVRTSPEGDTVTLITNQYPSGYTFALNQRIGFYSESD